MQRHTEGDNLLLITAFLGFYKAVDIIVVDNKQSKRSNRQRMRVEVFKLGKSEIVVYLASRANLDYLVAQEVVELFRDKNFTSKDKKGQNALFYRTNGSYKRSLLIITRLEFLYFSRFLYTYYYKLRLYLTY